MARGSKLTARKAEPAGTSSGSRLLAQQSTHNSSVTLFTMDDLHHDVKSEPNDDALDAESPRRRSKRIKLEHVTEEAKVPDIEDLQLPSPAQILRKSTQKGLADVEATLTRSPTAAGKNASKSPTKKAKLVPQALETPHPAPARWKETYETVREMRKKIKAPVDTMGCEQAQFRETEPKNKRFSTLVSLILSSQTKDEVTDAAVSKLREAVGGTLSVDAIINAESSVISESIAKVGFWRRKTDYVKQTAQRLHDDFDSDVPKTVDELCSLPGVGPKMAFLTLQVAWDLNHGIGVDVHVHRITNRLGWHKKPTKTPEETRLNLQSWLPKELHREINHMLVGFGQVVCLAVGPRCDECELSTKGLCPSAQKVVKSKKRKASGADSPPTIKVELEQEEEDSKAGEEVNSEVLETKAVVERLNVSVKTET